MKLIHLWVIMSMIVSGYALASKRELTAGETVVRIVIPFFMWPVIVGAELHNIKNEFVGAKK